MRRPRAFTSSRIRAEPLPPPARHLQGYYKTLEEDYATVVRSSGCNCGTCSSPSRAADERTRLPESAVSGTPPRRGQEWQPARKSNCADILTPSPLLDMSVRDKSDFGSAKISAARAPARRMLFNPRTSRAGAPIKTGEVKVTGVTNVAPVSTGSSERKRGSDRSDSISTLGKVASSFISATDGSDICTETTGPLDSGPSDGGSGFKACSHVSTAARLGGRSRGGFQMKVTQGERVSCGKDGVEPSINKTRSPRLADSKVDSIGNQSPVGGTAVRTIAPRNQETSSSNSASASLEEWKAPETGGTFSVGAPSQETASSRRRRTLRMRVGG